MSRPECACPPRVQCPAGRADGTFDCEHCGLAILGREPEAPELVCESCGDYERECTHEVLVPVVRVLDLGHAGPVEEWQEWQPACRACAYDLKRVCGWEARVRA